MAWYTFLTEGWVSYITDFMIYVGWWLIPIVILYAWKKKLDKYPIVATIYEKRGDHLIQTNDVLGRFEDPITNYKFKISKDTIPIPQYDWVLQCAYKPTNLFEKISNLLSGKIGSLTLFKYSSKQYKPVNIKLNNGLVKKVFRPIKNELGEEVYVNVYEYIDPRKAMSMLNFEVIDWDDINHMTQELRAIALRRSPMLKFMEKYGHWLAFGLAIVALIIAGYYYKEMIIDAGTKSAGIIGQKAASSAQEIATTPNVPIIGDLIPGK